jgi:hypothetical protein
MSEKMNEYDDKHTADLRRTGNVLGDSVAIVQ